MNKLSLILLLSFFAAMLPAQNSNNQQHIAKEILGWQKITLHHHIAENKLMGMGDLNTDDLFDYAVSSYNNDTLFAYLQQMDGNFERQIIDVQVKKFNKCFLADIDSDGVMEIVVSKTENPTRNDTLYITESISIYKPSFTSANPPMWEEEIKTVETPKPTVSLVAKGETKPELKKEGGREKPKEIITNAVVSGEWGDFLVQPTEDKVLLNWTITNNQKYDYYIIQRSTDGTVFEEIGRVKAAGTVESKSLYGFFDNNPLAGKSHYRLEFVENHQTRLITKAQNIEFNNKNITFYPNPVGDLLNVDLKDNFKMNAYRVEVRDASGRLLRTLMATNQKGKLEVSLAGLPIGALMVSVRLNKVGTQSAIVMKSK